QINQLPPGNAQGSLLYWDAANSDWKHTDGILNIGDQADGNMIITNTAGTGTAPALQVTDGANDFFTVRDDGFVGVGTNSPLTVMGQYESDPSGGLGWDNTMAPYTSSPIFSVTGGDIET